MSKLIDCPDCAGLGDKVNGISRRKDGSLKSVSFSLKEKCPTCLGTGMALVKRNVIYAGRPDLNRLKGASQHDQ